MVEHFKLFQIAFCACYNPAIPFTRYKRKSQQLFSISLVVISPFEILLYARDIHILYSQCRSYFPLETQTNTPNVIPCRVDIMLTIFPDTRGIILKTFYIFFLWKSSITSKTFRRSSYETDNGTVFCRCTIKNKFSYNEQRMYISFENIHNKIFICIIITTFLKLNITVHNFTEILSRLFWLCWNVKRWIHSWNYFHMLQKEQA